MALTPKQLRFCREYVLDLNATKAAERAGYKLTCAKRHGSRMLKQPEIMGAVSVLQAEMMSRGDMDADEVLKELAAIARLPMRDPGKNVEKMKALELMGKRHMLWVERWQVQTEEKPQFIFYWPKNDMDQPEMPKIEPPNTDSPE